MIQIILVWVTFCVVSLYYREQHCFGLGNPLLDITAKVDDEFLEK